jgi:hypothetical protein
MEMHDKGRKILLHKMLVHSCYLELISIMKFAVAYFVANLLLHYNLEQEDKPPTQRETKSNWSVIIRQGMFASSNIEICSNYSTLMIIYNATSISMMSRISSTQKCLMQQ